MEFWEYASVAVGVVVLTQGFTSLRNWWAGHKKKQEETQELLTEKAFKKFFNESILPDLERRLNAMIEDRIRARVQARYLTSHSGPE